MIYIPHSIFCQLTNKQKSAINEIIGPLMSVARYNAPLTEYSIIKVIPSTTVQSGIIDYIVTEGALSEVNKEKVREYEKLKNSIQSIKHLLK